MASDVLERLNKLIALANSPNENEARTAGVLACKMITEHNIRLSLPSESRRTVQNPVYTPQPAEDAGSPEPERRRRRRGSKRNRRRNDDHNYHLKSAPNNGKCKWCGEMVYKGEPCIHASRRYFHVGCAQRAEQFYKSLDF